MSLLLRRSRGNIFKTGRFSQKLVKEQYCAKFQSKNWVNDETNRSSSDRITRQLDTVRQIWEKYSKVSLIWKREACTGTYGRNICRPENGTQVFWHCDQQWLCVCIRQFR